jgi:hypothetical protein
MRDLACDVAQYSRWRPAWRPAVRGTPYIIRRGSADDWESRGGSGIIELVFA